MCHAGGRATVKRRGFLAALAAVVAAPKAVRLLPSAPRAPIKLVGLSGWLPDGVDVDFRYPARGLWLSRRPRP